MAVQEVGKLAYIMAHLIDITTLLTSTKYIYSQSYAMCSQLIITGVSTLCPRPRPFCAR